MKILSIRPSRRWQQANPPAPPVGNTAPVAINATYNATEGGTANVNLAATDVEGSGLTYTVLTQPTKGTLSGTAPSLIYTPTAGQYGVDSFTFKANDGTVDSNVATVTVNVSGGGYASSVTQNDITWTFDQPYPAGQFVNGEWWVVGPVTITSITPADPDMTDAIDIHGSSVNLVSDRQGIENRGKASSSKDGVSRYQRTLNIARQLPYTVANGSSLMSGISQNVYNDGYLSKAAVLTVLASAPPAGSFRPPYFGTNKMLFNESELDYSVLQNLAPTPNSPTPMSLVNARMKHVLIDIFTGGASANAEFKASDLTEHYGREIAKATTRAALALQLNYTNAQKRDLLIEVVQRGIDCYGNVLGGYYWAPEGGINQGRKLAMFIAAKALGHAGMLAWCDATNHRVFQEDGQHDFVNAGWTQYTPDLYGMPEWGGRAFERLENNRQDLEDGYRMMNSASNLGLVLVVSLMSGRSEWNHEAMFRYIIERYLPYESQFPNANRGLDSKNGIPRFTYEMWNAYFPTP